MTTLHTIHGDLPPGGVPAAMNHESIGSMSVEDKARLIFQHLGCGNHINRAQFQHLFKAVKLDLTEATVDDLFTKLQKFGDNRIEGLTFADMQRVVAVYPALYNVLASRVQDVEMDERQKNAIRREAVIKDELRDTFKQLDDVLGQDKNDVESLTGQKNKLTGDLKGVKDSSAGKRNELVNDHNKTKDAKQDLRDAMDDMRSAEKAHQQFCESLGLPALQQKIDDKERVKDRALEKVHGIEDDIQELERQIRELCGKLADAKAELAEKEGDVAAAKQEYDEKFEESRVPYTALEDATKNVQAKQNKLDGVQKREHQTAEELKDLLTEEGAIERGLGDVCEDLKEKHKMMIQKEDEVAAARQALDEQEKRVEEMEQANENFNKLRDQQYESEFNIVCQEIRLREQRETLELKEAIFRSEVERVVPQITSPPRSVYTPGTVPPSHGSLGTPYSGYTHGIATPPEHSPIKPTPLPGRCPREKSLVAGHSGRN
eukprot:TRINITY_DN42656_c0_g1_i1.p1 TRINITY_DN42656_c0_g1~~TRINITY_DN42656_c0_g1_i1.p1  ORF type:complete len:489 (+),score=111.36 TRINITY_DN42656_c0_g1_i1:40-1506(+)